MDKGVANKEEWRDIPGWEGLYQASSCGNIRSFHSGKPKAIVGGVTSDGYRLVILYRGQGKGRTGHNVHRLVCSAFHGKPADGMEAAHLDGDRRNNVPSNLAWATHAENLSHRHGHGTMPRGECHPKAILTEEQVRDAFSSPLPAKLMAEKLGVSRHTVSDIRERKRWRHVTADMPRPSRRQFEGGRKIDELPKGFLDAISEGLGGRRLSARFKISLSTAHRYQVIARDHAPETPQAQP